MAQPTRQRFQPARPPENAHVLAFQTDDAHAELWTPIIQCPADFPQELFEAAVSQLIHHPEYNSTLILRSETVHDTNDISDDLRKEIPTLKSYIPIRNVHRKLLPRRPGRDHGLEQHCTLYSSAVPEEEEHPASLLVLTPIIPFDTPLPYYHPTVSHLSFQYLSDASPPMLQISAVPLPGTDLDPNSRLYRTCLSLLETLHRYGWGVLTSYQKRVLHDRLVPREAYQDLYLVMRERYKNLVETWAEVTDPLKHVFEDIGIATFLMLLWKETYTTDSQYPTPSASNSEQPWSDWPRPPGGFLDFGCGNGLLVHILTSEGYTGYGIDVRSRQSWANYPASTQERLLVEAFDPACLTTGQTESSGIAAPVWAPEGCFIIANHADELTPWTPVLATLRQATGFVSIPCCAWGFDGRFERAGAHAGGTAFDFLFDELQYPISQPIPDRGVAKSPAKVKLQEGSGRQHMVSAERMSEDTFVESLALGGDGNRSTGYSTYRIWLAKLSLACGWKVECETLRIPSTRNWAIIGRKRAEAGEDLMKRVVNVVEVVESRGIFKARKPEGKAGGH